MELLFFHGTFCAPCAATEKAAVQYAADVGIPLYTFRCEDVYGGHEMAKQNRVRHIPCLILKDENGNEIVRSESAHTVDSLHDVLDKYLTRS